MIRILWNAFLIGVIVITIIKILASLTWWIGPASAHGYGRGYGAYRGGMNVPNRFGRAYRQSYSYGFSSTVFPIEVDDGVRLMEPQPPNLCDKQGRIGFEVVNGPDKGCYPSQF